MACVCVCIIFLQCPRTDYRPVKPKQKSYTCNKQLFNLKRLVFIGKSQTLALPYRPHYRSVNRTGSWFGISSKDLTLG